MDGLREQRIERGLTQAECAALVGVTETCWRNWEHGRHPMPKTARRLWEVIRMDKRKEPEQRGKC